MNTASTADNSFIQHWYASSNLYAMRWWNRSKSNATTEILGVRSLDLVHTSPTIQNNACLHVLYKDGALRMLHSWYPRRVNCVKIHSRCLAPPNNFDDPTKPITPRTKEHTIEVSRDSELLHAWDTFGMVSDVVVRLSFVEYLFY